MNLSADGTIEKYGKHCGHCNRNTLLLYEYKYTCISCGSNVIRRKHELSKIQRKPINFINRLKYAELKMFCICVDVYEICEGKDFDKIYEALSNGTNKKIKMNNTLIEKYKDLLEILISSKTIGPEQQKVSINLDMIVLD